MRKAKKAEYLDTLSSSQKDETRKKRLIKKNKKYSSSDESSVSDQSELEVEKSCDFSEFPKSSRSKPDRATNKVEPNKFLMTDVNVDIRSNTNYLTNNNGTENKESHQSKGIV